MIKLLLIAEFPDYNTEAQAQRALDRFRENHLPSEQGITIYRAIDSDARVLSTKEVTINRKDAADKALAGYNFEPNMVTDTGSWNEDGDEWTCLLSMDDANHQPFHSGFIVRFKPGTSEVTESYAGDPH